VREIEQTRRDIARAIEAGADAIELRIDAFEPLDAIGHMIGDFRTRFILTCRGEAEGGESTLAPADRLERVRSLLDHAGDDAMIDLEWADFAKLLGGDERDSTARLAGVDASAVEASGAQVPHIDIGASRVIASAHDFRTRPTDLTRRFADICASAAGVAKVAWTARSIRDSVEAFELLTLRPGRSVAICMGEAGEITRILPKKFGAYLGFASLDEAGATAPGQVSVGKLKTRYRWDSIGPRTRVYGVVGAPVGHSMSPAIHNAAFDAIGFDGVYVPLRVEAGYESFKAFMETFLAWRPMELRGLSVTIPHKENALRYAREKGWRVDAVAERIGALNTLVIDDASGLPEGVVPVGEAFSSDDKAILDAVMIGLGASDLEDRSALRGMEVAVLGAGGTGRTAVAALVDAGARVSIFNRTFERAAQLAREFGSRDEGSNEAADRASTSGEVIARPWSELAAHRARVWINTTSLGMSPEVEGSPFADGMPAMDASTVVFDCVYNPMETRLLREARDAGTRVVSGDVMFLRQAERQFEAWTGEKAPREVMRSALLLAMQKRQD
jgi:3-dehydroquinate dehydratase/shikimate dehydrogenase